MFVDDLRRAVEAAPRVRLAELSAAVWKGYAAGALAEGEAQSLAEMIETRKAVSAAPAATPRRQGSRPRSPASIERRRRWTSSGWLPPAIATRFTMGEAAALSVVAAEVARRGRCELALDAIAALAGVGRTTVRNALGEARRLGLLTVEVRRLRAFRNDTNVVRIASPEWQAWLSMRRSAPGQGVGAKACAARDTQDPFERRKDRAQATRQKVHLWSTRKADR